MAGNISARKNSNQAFWRGATLLLIVTTNGQEGN